MDSGLNKMEAISQTAITAGVMYNSVERALRKVSSRAKIPRNSTRGKRLIVIPDTQVKKGEPRDHIRAAARYIVKKKPDIVLVGGDWYDCPSLSVFNTQQMAEGLRLSDDLAVGNEAMDEFMGIIRAGIKKSQMPRLVYVTGNHDPQVRIPRYISKHPEMDGMIPDDTTPFLEAHGFEVYPFLDVIDIEGIKTAHYIQNPHSLKGSPLGGQMSTMLKNAGHSFIMFHQQRYGYDKQYLSDGSVRVGIVAGAFYQHHEDYMSSQGNHHWRGIFMMNEVKDGAGDMTEVSLQFLLDEYGD
jgi:predicted phosphodiesterase